MKPDELIIYSDMDGTLLTDWDRGPFVPEENMEAIRSFVSEGGLFSIASGRQYDETLAFFRGVSFPAPMVLANGAILYDGQSGEILKKTSLPETVKLECLDYRNRRGGLWLIAADEYGVYLIGSENPSWDRSLRDRERAFMTEEAYLSRAFVKACFVVADFQDVPAVTADLESFASAGQFRVTRSSPVFLEIIERSVGKAAGVAEAVRLAGAGARRLVCIGDYDNDCDMLAMADIAACPANSPPRVRGMAQIVTRGNNEGAVADLIRALRGM